MVYKTPPSSSPDDDALRVLATVLSSGRSSRFYENIVRQKQLAPKSSAFGGESRGPNLFSVVGTVNPGKTVAELEAAIDAEIERVKAGPIEDWEIEKARNNARNQLVNSLGSALDRAVTLGEDALFYNNPDRINTTGRQHREGHRRPTCSAWRSSTWSRPAAPSSSRCPRPRPAPGAEGRPVMRSPHRCFYRRRSRRAS